jgi:hypothetical protein
MSNNIKIHHRKDVVLKKINRWHIVIGLMNDNIYIYVRFR